MQRFSNSFVVMICCLLPSSHACLAAVQDLTFADANSLTEQALAYAESIKKGDVLVREIGTFEALDDDVDRKSPGILEESTMFYRVIFDFERERFAIYRCFDHEVEVLAERHAPDSLGRLVYGACYNSEVNDQVSEARFPGGPNRFSRSDFGKETMAFLRGLEFRDCRFAGLRLDCRAFEDDIVPRMRRQQTGDTTVEISQPDANTIEVVTVGSNIIVPEGWRVALDQTRERFDVQSGFRVYMVKEGKFISDNGDSTEIKSPYATLKVAWIDEVPVVESGYDRWGTSTLYNGLEYRGRQKTRYDFFWISLNKEIDDSLFDPKNLETANRILELLDPQQVDAKNLIQPVARLQTDEED